MKKIIIFIYAVVIVATALCALTFGDYVDINFGSLFVVAVLAYSLILGLFLGFRVLFLHGTHLKTRTLMDSDFKFSKNKGERGSFEIVDRDYKKWSVSDRNSKILSCVLLIGGASAIPFIFLFPFRVKIIASVILCAVVVFTITLIAFISDAIEMRQLAVKLNEKSAREKRELEEQKKREELGRWK